MLRISEKKQKCEPFFLMREGDAKQKINFTLPNMRCLMLPVVGGKRSMSNTKCFSWYTTKMIELSDSIIRDNLVSEMT